MGCTHSQAHLPSDKCCCSGRAEGETIEPIADHVVERAPDDIVQALRAVDIDGAKAASKEEAFSTSCATQTSEDTGFNSNDFLSATTAGDSSISQHSMELKEPVEAAPPHEEEEAGQVSFGFGIYNELRNLRDECSPGEQIFRDDLASICLLGCGAYGEVELVQHNITKKTYAMKVLNKASVTLKQHQQLVMREKTIQMSCNSPFLVRSYETFNEPESLLFLLELMPGGTVHDAYKRHELWGSKAHCHYYMGSAVYALEYMHERTIMFRDLKPDNMMLNALGKLKVCDFGLAKATVEKTYTSVGTPEYLAPEVITGKGHLHDVDWWTAGIVTFELMTGYTPFASEHDDMNQCELFQRVRRGMDLIVFPEAVSGPCEDLVRALAQVLPTERLPMKGGGVDNIKTHPFFGDFDWAGLLDETLVPPYIPVVRGRRDTRNFSVDELTPERLPAKLPYKDYDDGSHWDVDFATSMTFQNFLGR